MTLHTTANCTMPTTRAQTGATLTTDCDALVNDNVGCSVSGVVANSYGPSFNAAGGGWYVLERTNEGLSIWFWSRMVSGAQPGPCLRFFFPHWHCYV